MSFEFFDKGLTGVDEQEPRWKQAIESVNDNMGELLGQLYVEKHFQAESKARMDIMIQNLIKAYEVSITRTRLDERRDQAAGARQTSQIHTHDRLSGEMDRLFETRSR